MRQIPIPNRGRTKSGRWRKKRSDAGKPRKKKVKEKQEVDLWQKEGLEEMDQVEAAVPIEGAVVALRPSRKAKAPTGDREMDGKILPILSCDARSALHLNKGAAMFLVNGGVIPAYRVKVSVCVMKTDDDGKLIPDGDGNPIIECIEDMIVSVEIGYMKEGE